VRPAWAHPYGCKSHRELITTNEAKRNCMRVTECGESAPPSIAVHSSTTTNPRKETPDDDLRTVQGRSSQPDHGRCRADIPKSQVAVSYGSFRKCIIALNDAEHGCFTKAARRYGRVCSPGERELLKGILLLTDFAHVADEIAVGEAFSNMTRCGGDFRAVFAACVLNAGW
jgi:hypothetical protein